MQFQIETEKPNAVAFSIPADTKAASPEKLSAIKEKLEKRLTHGEPCCEANFEEKLSKAQELRDTRIKE
jgi:hypothetical protein